MPKYGKPSSTTGQLLNLLQARGMAVLDVPAAEQFLATVSYYRLSGYTLSFEIPRPGVVRSHQFRQGSTFEQVVNLYEFDRRLRLLTIDALERIEIAVRSSITVLLAEKHQNPHWYMQSQLFGNGGDHRRFINQCHDGMVNSKERFMVHYRKAYTEPYLPPAWAVAEILSLGVWSHLFKNLKERADQKLISDAFGIPTKDFESDLHHLTYLRNTCAHHARLWNREFTITPKLKQGSHVIPALDNRSYAAAAGVIRLFLYRVAPDMGWTTALYQLMLEYPQIDFSRMGFLPYWYNDPFWGVRP